MADAVGFLFIRSFPILKAKARKGKDLNYFLAHRFNGGRLGNPGLIYFFIHPRLKPRAVLQFMIIILFQISASMY